MKKVFKILGIVGVIAGMVVGGYWWLTKEDSDFELTE